MFRRQDQMAGRTQYLDGPKENARRDATPRRGDTNFWWRGPYQFARLTATCAGAISNLTNRFDGHAAQLSTTF
jgi:hypothetical protein